MDYTSLVNLDGSWSSSSKDEDYLPNLEQNNSSSDLEDKGDDEISEWVCSETTSHLFMIHNFNYILH